MADDSRVPQRHAWDQWKLSQSHATEGVPRFCPSQVVAICGILPGVSDLKARRLGCCGKGRHWDPSSGQKCSERKGLKGIQMEWCVNVMRSCFCSPWFVQPVLWNIVLHFFDSSCINVEAIRNYTEHSKMVFVGTAVQFINVSCEAVYWICVRSVEACAVSGILFEKVAWYGFFQCLKLWAIPLDKKCWKGYP